MASNNKTEKIDDATPVYRAYRKQIIFILYKILLSNEDNLIFHPEGIEDFSIESNGIVKSVYQVKDISSGLTLSDLLPQNKDTAFIYRAFKILNENPSTEIYVAHYYPLGKELKELFEGNEGTLDALSNKISQKGIISKDSAKRLLKALHFQQLSENELTRKIEEILSVSLTGIDVDAAFNCLCWWIFEASEKRNRITKKDTIDKIQNIGGFIRERSLHHEWLGSIQPFNELSSDSEDIEQLKKTYTQGISATMSHIKNDLDIRRDEKLARIDELFKANNIVIIHGASGQGKTSLALRYFLDYLPPELSYQIKEPGDRDHAYSIAEAVLKHHDAFHMPVFLFYDISSTDTHWPYLIEQLSQRKNIKILASIREEHWRRTLSLNEKIDFEEIDLDFTQEEARMIFSRLNQHAFPDFENSWIQFGNKGPLLEYIYFLRCGEKLGDRLKAQIESLKIQVNLGKIEAEALELLRIVALVTGFEARLTADKISSLIKLPAPESLLHRFEKEYLLRFSPESNLIEGFHPVRSKIMAEYLFDNTSSSWINIFDKAFPAILEDDIGIFLFHTFSRQKTIEIEHVRGSLNLYSPKKWSAYTGIISSLLWLGIKNYAETNRYLVEELKEKEPHLDFKIILDIDIGGVKPELAENLIQLFSETAPGTGELKKAYQKSQTDKKEIFLVLKEWLSQTKKSPENPVQDGDYIGLSKAAFWIGYLHIKPVLVKDIGIFIESVIDKLDISIISELMYGFSYLKKSDIYKIAESRQESIIRKFCKRTGTISFEKTDTMVKAHYIIQLEPAGTSFVTSDKENNNAKSMAIIDILRKLFPFMQYYSTQGYGHRNIRKEINIPDTYSNGEFKEIPCNNLPSPDLVELNSIFIGYMEYKYRPETWQEYIKQIIGLRELQYECFDRLIKGLNRYFKKKVLNDIINEDNRLWLTAFLNEINKIPGFPKTAVDEWGFTREDMGNMEEDNTSHVKVKIFFPALQKYKEYRNNCRDIFSDCYFFVNNAAQLIIDRIKKEEHGDTRSSLILLDIYNYLIPFQIEFAQHFGSIVNGHELRLLEKKEQKIYSQIFSLWWFFCYRPESKINNNSKDYRYKFVTSIFKQRFINSLKKGIPAVEDVDYIIKEGMYNNKNSLWIIVDFNNLHRITGIDLVLKGISNAFKNAIAEYDQNEIDCLLRYHWHNLCIVFAYRGKILIPFVKQQYFISSVRNENAPFFDSPYTDPEFEQSFNLAVWHNKQIDTANQFYANFTALRLTLGHIEEIISPAEGENADRYIIDKDTLTEYLKELTTNSISKAFQGFLDAIVTLHKRLKQIEKPEEHIESIDALNVLCTNRKQFFPYPDQETKGEFEYQLNTDVIKEWKKRLDAQSENVTGIFFLILLDSLKLC